MDEPRLKTLDEIAIEMQTDRASVFTRTYAKPHDYARHYDNLFGGRRHYPVRVLEIGAAGGEGIRMWLEYFDHPEARIFGVDIVSNTNPFNTPGRYGRYTFNQGDQSSTTFWDCWLADHGGDLDVVVDDGGHYNDGIITSFNSLWPAVKRGGFYAIEDLGCAYGQCAIFVRPGFPNHIPWLHGRIDEMNTGARSDIDFIYLSRELAVMRKAL